MDFSFDIPDSTDWLNTPLSKVAPLESALRCQVCKDFFDNPVITSCSHTFCSLCIRRCLSSEGKCPTCRGSDQEVRLRRNWAVQELVDTFKDARADILALARAQKPVAGLGDARQSDDATGEPAAKRRRVDDPSDQSTSLSVQREPQTTAPHSRGPDSSAAPAVEAVESSSPGHAGSDDVHRASPSRAHPSVNPSSEPSDDIVACPICNRKMKNEAVFGHLDSCPGPSSPPTESSTPTPSTPTPAPLRRGRPPKYSQLTPFGPRQSTSSDNNNKPPERLPALNYALLKDTALRKKLRELGIPDWGPRQLLQRRHTEWMNLWNANCDARVPKSHAELLRDLDMWERSQGGLATNSGASASGGGSSIMAKDFNAKAWSASHGDAFKDLIAKARQGKDSVKGSSTETTKAATTTQTTAASAPLQTAAPSPMQTTTPPASVQTTTAAPMQAATPVPGQTASPPVPMQTTMPPAPTQNATPAPTKTTTPPAPMYTAMPPGPMHAGMQPAPMCSTMPPAPMPMTMPLAPPMQSRSPAPMHTTTPPWPMPIARPSEPMQPTPTAALMQTATPAPAPMQNATPPAPMDSLMPPSPAQPTKTPVPMQTETAAPPAPTQTTTAAPVQAPAAVPMQTTTPSASTPTTTTATATPAPVQTTAPAQTTETAARTSHDQTPETAPTKSPEPGSVSK